MGDAAKQTGGSIFGGDDTAVQVRKGTKQTEVYTRLFRHKFGEAPTTSRFLPLKGFKNQPWYVLLFASAFPQCMLPRDHLAIANQARRIRIKSMSSCAYAFSSYITSASQTLQSVNTIPNSYFYCVKNEPKLLPEYNVDESYYDVGGTDITADSDTELRQWALGPEPTTMYYSGSPGTLTTADQNLILMNHPNFSLIRQIDEVTGHWINSDDHWWHPASPYITNANGLLSTLIGDSTSTDVFQKYWHDYMASTQTDFLSSNVG